MGGARAWTPFVDFVFCCALSFVAGLVLLAWALNRQGNFGGGPMGVVGDWFREAVKWDVYQLERGSGWVQKLFDEMPDWLRLPFVTIYGIFQPVLPAVFIEPTTLTWRITGIIRALGWYLFWPLLLYAFIAALKDNRPRERRLWLWITVISWLWIILTALRGGGDQWDNPRYRAILLLWQALAAGYAWACFRARSDSVAGTYLVDRRHIPGLFYTMVPESLLPYRWADPVWVDGWPDYWEQPCCPGGRRVVGSSSAQGSHRLTSFREGL